MKSKTNGIQDEWNLRQMESKTNGIEDLNVQRDSIASLILRYVP